MMEKCTATKVIDGRESAECVLPVGHRVTHISRDEETGDIFQWSTEEKYAGVRWVGRTEEHWQALWDYQSLGDLIHETYDMSRTMEWPEVYNITEPVYPDDLI